MSEEILSLPPPAADERVRYGDAPSHFLDVRHARSPARAVVVNLHGGFWRARYDLAHAGHLCAALAAHGFETINLEYRRVGEEGGGDPGTFEDALRGTSRAVEHARAFGHGALPVVLLGHSAGGHLALWVGARLKSALAGVVALAPVADLADARARGLGSGAVDTLVTPERIPWASPAALLPLGVRQVVVHGELDDTVPFDLAAAYVAKARAAGDEARIVALPGMGHYEVIDPGSRAWASVVGAIEDVVAAAGG